MVDLARKIRATQAQQGGFSSHLLDGPAFYAMPPVIDSLRIKIETTPIFDGFFSSFQLRAAIIDPDTGTFAPSARNGPECGGTVFTDVNQPWVLAGQNWYALSNTLSARVSSTPGADTRCQGGFVYFNLIFKVAEYIQLTGALRAVIRIGTNSNTSMNEISRPVVSIDAAEGGEWLRDPGPTSENIFQTINPSAINIYENILLRNFNQKPDGNIFIRDLTWLNLNFATNTFAFSKTQPPNP